MGAPQGDRLESWKEIAAYLRRSVRTVRRWEAGEGLPVHRQMHRALGSVYAFKTELDAWRQAAAADLPRGPKATASIAVLPFKNLSADPDNEYFADGLTDEVTSDLSKVSALRVTSRTSSMSLKGTSKDVKTIARDMDVRYIVEGSVRRAGDRLRVTAHLIDTGNDRLLWSDKYDGTMDDVFAIQERLARVIVDALKVRLTASEERTLSDRPIGNVHVYECYLQARREAFRWRRDSIDRAVRLLEDGLAIAGQNARLYAALGWAHLQYREAGVNFTDGPLQAAETCARRVFALDPRANAGWRLRGWIDYSRGRVQDAVRHLATALEADPNDRDTLALLSNCYLISGKVEAARPLIRRLLAVDPLTPLTRCMPGFADIMEGRFEAALGPYREMFEMDPGNPMARLFYVWILVLNGRTDAVGRIAATHPLQADDAVPARLAHFLARAVAGERRAALAVITPEVEAAAGATDLFARFFAQGYAMAGMPDRALHWLAVAVQRGFINYPFLARHDPVVEPLRRDPRFQRLMKIVRARWSAFTVARDPASSARRP